MQTHTKRKLESISAKTVISFLTAITLTRPPYPPRPKSPPKFMLPWSYSPVPQLIRAPLSCQYTLRYGPHPGHHAQNSERDPLPLGSQRQRDVRLIWNVGCASNGKNHAAEIEWTCWPMRTMQPSPDAMGRRKNSAAARAALGPLEFHSRS